ncbi:MAG TPA: hypothetical protein VJH20_05475 [Candidatus Nanoarchaeia archaeon]|nr:hypothetical protein [Candidatus Nanoarchaeia archaeon]
MDVREILYNYYWIIAAISFAALLMFVSKASDDSLFKEKAKTMDLAFTFNSVVSSPGVINVREDIQGFVLSLDNKCTFFSDGDKLIKVGSRFNCVNDGNLDFKGNPKMQNNVIFKKDNILVSVSEPYE